MQGLSANDINNGNMNVTELEVYKVTYDETKLKKPWRDIDVWNEKSSFCFAYLAARVLNTEVTEISIYFTREHQRADIFTRGYANQVKFETLLDKLKEEITTFKPLPDLDFCEAKIAMIGPVGAGKSSLYNTIESIFRGRISKRACSGSAEQSITTGYIPYTVRTESGAILNFSMCDTPGLENSAGLDVYECGCLLDGNIPNFYQFNSNSPLSPKTEGFEAYPTTKDMILCVVFVLDATTLDVLSSEVIEKMKKFQGLMNTRGIPQLVVLTKIDNICKDVQKDISFTYKSWVVEEHVEKASQLLGLPRSNVLLVKNYEKETKLDININILTLLALRQILHSTEDFMFNLLDRQRFAQMGICEK